MREHKSGYPIGKHYQLLVALFRVVVGDVHAKIVHPIHALVHHETHRNSGLLTGIEDHRTEVRYRWSTTLLYFHVWLFAEAQRLIAHVCKLKRDRNRLTQRNVAQIYLVLIYF
jgi:hypothetical protein